MARMPDVTWAGEHGSGTLDPQIVCIHTIVGYAPAHAAHFSTRASGEIIQSRDTRYRSAANYNGNYRVIAIENEDHGPAYGAWSGSNVPGFTDAQMWSIAKICAWAHITHGIPLVLCPDSRPGSRGIAYHRQGCDGNFGSFAYPGRVSGGELWSTSVGKVCPGDRRIKQLIEIIIPRARLLAAGGAPIEEEDEMAGWLDESSGQGYTRSDGTTGVYSMKDLEVGNNKAHWATVAALNTVIEYLGNIGAKLDILNQKLDGS